MFMYQKRWMKLSISKPNTQPWLLQQGKFRTSYCVGTGSTELSDLIAITFKNQSKLTRNSSETIGRIITLHVQIKINQS